MTNSRDIPRATPFVFLEIAIYGALVAAYLLFVLKALSPFLQAEAGSHHLRYALLCLGLMLGQGFLLEFLTSWLLKLVSGRRRGR